MGQRGKGDEKELLNLSVNGIFFQEGIELLEFEAVRRVFAVLLGMVARHAGHARRFVLCTFQNDRQPVAFLFGHRCLNYYLRSRRNKHQSYSFMRYFYYV